jgi:hypothetical protein
MRHSQPTVADLKHQGMLGKLGGREVMTLAQLQGAIASGAPKGSVAIQVVRDGLLVGIAAMIGEGKGSRPLLGVGPVSHNGASWVLATAERRH